MPQHPTLPGLVSPVLSFFLLVLPSLPQVSVGTSPRTMSSSSLGTSVLYWHLPVSHLDHTPPTSGDTIHRVLFQTVNDYSTIDYCRCVYHTDQERKLSLVQQPGPRCISCSEGLSSRRPVALKFYVLGRLRNSARQSTGLYEPGTGVSCIHVTLNYFLLLIYSGVVSLYHC